MRVRRSCTCLGSFTQGVLNGPAIMVFSDGDLYVGHAKAGLRHGNGLLELADGTLYAGHFSQVRGGLLRACVLSLTLISGCLHVQDHSAESGCMH